MKFKWDWNKKELVEGKQDEKAFPVAFSFILVGCVLFIEVVCPLLGKILFGGFIL